MVPFQPLWCSHSAAERASATLLGVPNSEFYLLKGWVDAGLGDELLAPVVRCVQVFLGMLVLVPSVLAQSCCVQAQRRLL